MNFLKFEDKGRTLICRSASSPATPGTNWLWLDVGGESQRYAEFEPSPATRRRIFDHESWRATTNCSLTVRALANFDCRGLSAPVQPRVPRTARRSRKAIKRMPEAAQVAVPGLVRCTPSIGGGDSGR